MGLDSVELVMAFEEEFDIQIEDADAEKMRAPRHVIDYVMSKVPNVSAPTPCLSQRGFNVLRWFLMKRLGMARKTIKPGVRLKEILPPAGRQAFLNDLALSAVTGPWLVLVRPAWLTTAIFAVSVVLGIFAALAAFPVLKAGCALFGVAIAVGAGYLGARFTRPLRTDFPSQFTTIGDLAQWVITHKRDLAKPNPQAWTREKVAARVREIVVDQLGCEAHYREDAKFVEDLGMY